MSLRPINRLPRGFLSLLDLQTAGRVPNEVSELVMPTVDMQPFWAAQKTEDFVLNRAAVVGAPGGVAGVNFAWTSTGPNDLIQGAGLLQVPQGELWLVEHYAAFMQMTNAAGNWTSILPALRVTAGGNRYYMPHNPAGSAMTIGGAVATTTWTGFTTTRPFWALPGQEIMVVVAALVLSADATLAGTLRVVRLIA